MQVTGNKKTNSQGIPHLPVFITGDVLLQMVYGFLIITAIATLFC